MGRRAVRRVSKRRLVGSSTSGKLGRKAPNITAEWGPVTAYQDDEKRRFRTITLKHPGRCRRCGVELAPGLTAEWAPGYGIRCPLPC
jgi:hypothetical protein